MYRTLATLFTSQGELPTLNSCLLCVLTDVVVDESCSSNASDVVERMFASEDNDDEDESHVDYQEIIQPYMFENTLLLAQVHLALQRRPSLSQTQIILQICPYGNESYAIISAYNI